MRRRPPKILTGILVVALAVAALYFAAGSWSGLDGLRTDFVALRYVDDAMRAARSRPIKRHEAKAALARALALAPDNAVVRASALDVFLIVEDYESAARALYERGSSDPYLLGLCLVKTGQEKRGAQLLTDAGLSAKELYRQGRLGEKSYAMQLNNIGYVLADAGVRLMEAKGMLEIATGILPLDSNCVDSLGWLYYRLGNYHMAVFYLERAVRQQEGPGEPELLYHLGAAYAREGRVYKARKHLRSALQLDPEHEAAGRALQQLNWSLPSPALTQRPSSTLAQAG